MISTLFKATGIWFIIFVAAIFNGVFREKALVPLTGAGLALPLSGMLLAGLVFFITLSLISCIGSSEAMTYFGIGLLWVVLTLSFEFLFGHFVADKPWQEILRVFYIWEGDLFLVVVLVTAVSPWFAGKIRGVF